MHGQAYTRVWASARRHTDLICALHTRKSTLRAHPGSQRVPQRLTNHPGYSTAQPGRRRCPSQAFAGEHPGVGWEVDGCSFSMSLRGGGAGTTGTVSGSDGGRSSDAAASHQQLLRLQEQSVESEYVLLLPASVSGVLVEVLQRAVLCVQTGNDGRPLELHHTVLSGSRTFKCSLVYSPATPHDGSRSSSSNGTAPLHEQQEAVTITVQELGRSCVQLPVSTAVLQPVQQLIQLLQQAEGQPPQQTDGRPQPQQQQITQYASLAAADASTETSSTSPAQAEATADAEAATDAQAAAHKEEAEAGDTTTTSSSSSRATFAPPAAAASPADASSPSSASSSRPPPSAPEVLFAAISTSSTLKEGLRFAHAASAEAPWAPSTDTLSTSTSTSSSGGVVGVVGVVGGDTRLFQLPHLCGLWQKLPVYAASLQREVLQLGPDVPDEEVLTGAPLYPEAQQELQALLQVLVPLMQPQLSNLPKHMLQRLLQAVSIASLQLPDSFLAAWATAAATARGCWDTEGPSALFEVTMLLLQVQETDPFGVLLPQHPPQQRGPVVLPLQWCADALAAVSQQLQQAAPQLYSATALAAQAGNEQQQQQLQELLPLQEQLVPVLLAAAGHQLEQRQLLWQPWGHKDPNSTTSSSASSNGITDADAAACQASLARSLRMLLAAEPPQHTELHEYERALVPGMQQSAVLEGVAGLLAQQQAAAVALVWSWLAHGGGAQAIDTALLRQLLEQLPYDSSAAEHSAAVAADGEAASRQGGDAVQGSSLLQRVLVAHAQERGDAAVSSVRPTEDSYDVQQLEAVCGLLRHSLGTDVRAAFAALPAMLQVLPHSTTSRNDTASSSSSQRWEAGMAELSDQLQQMLSLGPQQLLQHGAAVLQAVGQLSTSPGCVLTVLQLTQQLAGAADSWHAAAAAEPQLAGQQLQADDAAQPVSNAAQLVSCCWEFAPGFAGACMVEEVQQQQQQRQTLSVLAEVLQSAAALHEQHAGHNSLAPAWLGSSSNGSSPWAGFKVVVLAAAVAADSNSSSTALDAADIAAAASALMLLGVQPSQQLLQLYLEAVGPEAPGLSAVGLQQLLWISAAALVQPPPQHTSASSSSSGSSSSSSASASKLLRLATKACSSLAVRSTAALSARQAAKVTWALAQLAGSEAAAAAGWSPPQQVLTWLRRVWQGMDTSTGTLGSSVGAGDLQQTVKELSSRGLLQQQEAAELLDSMQRLGLCPSKQPPQQQQLEQQQQEQDDDVQASAAETVQPPPELLQPPQQPDQATAPPPQEAQQKQQDSPAAKQGVHPLLQHQQLLREQLGSKPRTGGLKVHTLNTTQSSPGPAASSFLAARKVKPVVMQAQERDTAVAAATPAAATPAAATPAAATPAPATTDTSAPTPAATADTPSSAVSATEGGPSAWSVDQEEVDTAPDDDNQSQAVETPPADAEADVEAAAAAAATAAAADVPPSTASADTAAVSSSVSNATADTIAAPEEPADVASPAEVEAADVQAAAATTPAAAAVDVPPPSIVAVLQQLQEPGFSPSQKQAFSLLLPVQKYIAAGLSPAELLSYLDACFTYKMHLSADSLLAASHAVAAQAAGPQAPPTRLVLQLLSALSDASIPQAAAAAAASSGVAGSAAAPSLLLQQAPELLRKLLPVLRVEQLSAVSAGDLLQLLRDVYTLITGSRPPKAAALPVGTTLFGSQAATGSSGASSSAAAEAVADAWLAGVAAALQPKLLLFPHGSHLLQSLQLLQALGHQQPSSSFMASFLAAADALLDTLSGRNCLELLAATAAAGQLPSTTLTAALLQHLVPLKLAVADVAAGCRLLASLGIRPSAELLLSWFAVTEAAAAQEQLAPEQVLQVLWACTVWQLQPPTTWLNAVIKGLMPAGRLSSSCSATLAGICRCLWQLGVQPAPGFVAAVTAAAQHSLQDSPRHERGKQQAGLTQDVESLSVLCHCLLMWQHAGTPAWRAAVTERATALMPCADGPALLRMGLYLSYLQQGSELQDQDSAAGGGADDDDELQPWQETFLQAVPQALAGHDNNEVVMTADGQAVATLPAWALVLLAYVLTTIPQHSLPVLRSLVAAQSSCSGALTTWDVVSLLPTHLELLQVLQQLSEDANGPLAGVKLQQLQQECDSTLAAAAELLKHAYQQRQGAPADALATLPLLADAFGIEMPQQSRSNLGVTEAAAREREQQLQQALLLQAQGGPAVPETLLEGLAELDAGDAPDMVSDYAAAPLQAALQRRMYLLGSCVSDDWVLRGLSSGC